MKIQAQYDHGFADLYADWVASAAAVTEPNRRFYVQRFLEAPGTVVELGVGDGRIAVEAAAAGKPVIGVDNSKAMLELAEARASQRGVQELLTLQLADFRDFELAQPASLIAIPFHSIGHLLSAADKLACMRHVHRNLQPGGHFLFDHFIPDLDLARANEGRQILRSHIVDEESGAGRLLWAVSSYDLETGVIQVRAIQEQHDAEGLIHSRRVCSIPLSTIEPSDSRRLLEQAGFEIEDCFGDFEGNPLGADSSSQVWVARRAPAAHA